MTPAHIVTKDSIVVVIDGDAYTIKRGDENFEKVRDAVTAKSWGEIPKLISKALVVKKWAGKAFEVKGASIYYQGEPLPTGLNNRIVKMARSGDNPSFLLRFWERLQKNPSYRSVEQLYNFLQHTGIPITKDGCFLAYKGVRDDYKDCHSGKFDNSPGALNEMPRNKISDDPNQACHEGFHVGAVSYAKSFGPRCVVCKVDPADVVSVPKDSSAQKMRVCKYIVVGLYGADLPDTIYEDETDDAIDATILAALKDQAAPAKPKIQMPDPPSKKDLAAKEKPEAAKTDLKDFTLQELRKHAMALGITGASKVPGGKEGLLEVIRVHTKKQGGGKETKGLAGMDEAQLMKQSLDTLRKYASHDLLITGASKIPGGKEALVEAILKVRK